MSLPKLYSLAEVVAAFGSSGVTIQALRKEVHTGRLRAVRTSPGANAKILLREKDVTHWLANEAGKRQRVLSPSATRRASGKDKPEPKKFR